MCPCFLHGHDRVMQSCCGRRPDIPCHQWNRYHVILIFYVSCVFLSQA
ncbi:hypothetical protein MtrunA17_Chr3g0083101 [Medicago truncatula]|uniref:Uncharacterized protein n=1 Tax=Medicago truncatula TaxID=3880 RepID=A0A396IJD3_MEDTR|nr:hypothetical protein MtrunA17_Chr3g0083101 [Medicago truncatula]